jgi:hypothetical protein
MSRIIATTKASSLDATDHHTQLLLLKTPQAWQINFRRSLAQGVEQRDSPKHYTWLSYVIESCSACKEKPRASRVVEIKQTLVFICETKCP